MSARSTRRDRAPRAGRWTPSGRALAAVPDPEIPVISVVELGIVRDVAWRRRRSSSSRVTPTYSGCPATEVIAADVAAALDATPASPARGSRRSSRPPGPPTGSRRKAKRKAARLRHRAAGDARGRAARSTSRGISAAAPRQRRRCRARAAARRTTQLLSQFGSTRVQGAVPLRRLPRAVRLLQAALSSDRRTHEQVPSAAGRHASSARRATPSRSRSTCPTRCASSSASSQGQHLTLRADIDGEDVRRSYSICSAVQDGALRVAVKKRAGRRVLDLGQRVARSRATAIDVMPPMGHFNVPLDAAQSRALPRLRRRQRHHAAAVDHQDDAR